MAPSVSRIRTISRPSSRAFATGAANVPYLLNSASKTRDFSHADTEADFFAPEKKVIKV